MSCDLLAAEANLCSTDIFTQRLFLQQRLVLKNDIDLFAEWRLSRLTLQGEDVQEEHGVHARLQADERLHNFLGAYSRLAAGQCCVS